MENFFQTSLFAGVTVSLVAYALGVWLKKKLKFAFINPLLISIVFTIGILLIADIDYEVYNQGAVYLAGFLHRLRYVLPYRFMSSSGFLKIILRQYFLEFCQGY